MPTASCFSSNCNTRQVSRLHARVWNSLNGSSLGTWTPTSQIKSLVRYHYASEKYIDWFSCVATVITNLQVWFLELNLLNISEPDCYHGLVDLTGYDPATSCVQSKCSPDWATSPYVYHLFITERRLQPITPAKGLYIIIYVGDYKGTWTPDLRRDRPTFYSSELCSHINFKTQSERIRTVGLSDVTDC